uniref:Structural maintenance of chromosomes protein 4-like n=1 Tax=Dermatophagoides pteronyssinus TaxID=6956 RepID=A0A6P6YBZ7_DERPT|nr:structural maintenance of chromosomes protein 4-like [Dermatophagoides pteronyssinus]
MLDNGILVIRCIEVENFKTYAGKVVIGPFNRGFNAIIGENGSGKSNIIDALCFVFGTRAKKLRHNKQTGLIHQSENQKPTFSKVTIFFSVFLHRNDTVPLRDFSIGKSITLDNQSKYFINDNGVSYAEIRGELLQYNINLNRNRFLIFQGEIEKFSLLRPKASENCSEGLLEMCEELIGTNKFIEEIKRLELDLVDIKECVKDTMNAKNLSKSFTERLKIVTLNGEVIEKSGSITGGNAINYLSARHLYLNKDVDDFSKLHDKINLINQKIDEQQNKVIELKRDINYLTVNCVETSKVEMKYKIDEGVKLQNKLEKQKELYKVKSKQYEEVCVRLENVEFKEQLSKLDDLKKEEIFISTKKNMLTSRIQELESKIDKESSSEKNILLKKLNKNMELISQYTSIKTNYHVDSEIKKQRSVRLKDEKIEKLKSDLDRIEKSIQELEEELAETQRNLKTISNTKLSIKTGQTEKDRLKQLSETKENLLILQKNFQRDKITVEKVLEDIFNEHKTESEKVSHIESKINQLCVSFDKLPPILLQDDQCLINDINATRTAQTDIYQLEYDDNDDNNLVIGEEEPYKFDLVKAGLTLPDINDKKLFLKVSYTDLNNELSKVKVLAETAKMADLKILDEYYLLKHNLEMLSSNM